MERGLERTLCVYLFPVSLALVGLLGAAGFTFWVQPVKLVESARWISSTLSGYLVCGHCYSGCVRSADASRTLIRNAVQLLRFSLPIGLQVAQRAAERTAGLPLHLNNLVELRSCMR